MDHFNPFLHTEVDQFNPLTRTNLHYLQVPITLDAREDNNKGGFPLVLTISVAAVVLAEDDKPGEAGAGLHPGLPGTSFRPWKGDVEPKMDCQSGT